IYNGVRWKKKIHKREETERLKQKKFLFLLATMLLLIVGCAANEGSKDENSNNGNDAKGTEEASREHEAPKMEELDPDDPKTETIQYGEELFNETNTVASDYVGNELSCQSCHADGGYSQSSTMVGVTADYAQYRPREGITFTLEDRINGCMVRSMNGKMFPSDSEEMRGMVAYLTYLSEGVEIGAERPWVVVNLMEEVPEPDVVSGEELYESKNCLTCHGDSGEGTGAN